MEIKVTLNDRAFTVDELEDMVDIMNEAKNAEEEHERALEVLQSDFSEYGELTAEPEESDKPDSEISKSIGVTLKNPDFRSKVKGKVKSGMMDQILSEIVSDQGTRLQTIEVLRGRNKGRIALMWPSGGYLHSDPGTDSRNLARLYQKAHVPENKRACFWF